MNFFEHQYKARRKTWLLIVYFLAAVTLIILSINLVVYLVYFTSAGETSSELISLAEWFSGPVALWIMLGTLAVIILGSLHTVIRLRGGGRSIAEMVGARRVNSSTSDINERRLINIVEEMSIASGTPVPELYIMDEESINAFVAGYRPTETVMVVTRGALNNFNRDEMQGVVGHEYSHIFNGDMRINIRLMGLLAGILLIGQIGGFILRSSGRRRSSSDKGGGQIMLIGLALFIIGYVGLFFGSLIKAAVSRQREFLADASSVQFTRNPDGISNALHVIMRNTEGSRLINSHAEDVSHFCFSNAVGEKFMSMLATHPPLKKRIQAINPRFDFAQASEKAAARQDEEPEEPEVKPRVPPAAAGVAAAAVVTAVINGSQASSSIGQVEARHLDYAEKTRENIPDLLTQAAHDEAGARQLVYALVIADMKPEHREHALALIGAGESGDLDNQAGALIPEVEKAGQESRLPLVNMAIPSLRSLAADTRTNFLKVLEDVIRQDKRYTVFEFALLTILREQLSEQAGRDVKVKYFKSHQVLPEINLLLSVLARTGARSEEQAQNTYTAIVRHFTSTPLTMASRQDCKLDSVTAALHKLNLLSPMIKQSLITAFADCVIHDGKVTPSEAELLQAICISLDCPMPPLMA